MSETRTVTVECTWTSTHTVEVPADTPRIDSGDMSTLLTFEDVDSSTASLVDWDIKDSG